MNTCNNCGKTLNNSNKFCSKECYYESKNIQKKCPGCGDEFKTPQSVDSKFCSQECSVENQEYQTGEDSNFYEGGKVEIKCNYCGDKKKVWPKNKDKKYCDKECMAKDYASGKLEKSNHPRWRGKTKKKCMYCGEEFSFRSWLDRDFCSRTCRFDYLREKNVGENHHNWKGGKVGYYGSNWVKQRRKALNRDDYKCRICGNSKKDLGREPSVHHIKPIREFDDLEKANKLDNLICLCPSHHHVIEGWQLVPSNVKL